MENHLVVKSNDLIEARYELSLLEQKIILYAVSKLDRETEKFNVLPITVNEFIELMGTTAKRYTEIREVVSSLMSKQLYIKTSKGELLANWVSSLEYIEGTGIIELEFSEKLIPYLLHLKKCFTRYQLKNVLYLKNKYSIRIYELLKQYENMAIDYRIFTIEDLRRILAIEEDHYTRFFDFEKRVLKPVCEEISRHTDIRVSYEKIKKGRAVESIKFKVSYDAENEYIELLNNTYDINDLRHKMGLDKANFNTQQIMDLYVVATEKVQDKVDPFAYVALNYQHMIKSSKARNKFAYLKKSLEEDYAKAFAQLKHNHIIKY